MTYPQVTAPQPKGRTPGWLPDTVAGGVTTLLLLVITAHVPPGPHGRATDVLGYALLLAAGGAMGLVRRQPRTAVAVTTAALCVELVRNYPNGPMWATGWISLAGLSWQTSRRTALAGAAGMLAALSVCALATGSDGLFLPLIFIGWSAAAILSGDALRDRRRRIRELQERARFLEQTREEVALRRVAEERLRIARDLHDSVAHAIATINVQAGAAAHVLDRQPEAAGAALVAIQRTSGEVLDELGAMLSVLRDENQQADRAPAPGIGQIPRLVDSVGASGLKAELIDEGPAPDVSPVVSTAAFRVVQESLTNIIRHSRAREARVEVVTTAGSGLTILVSDAGPATVAGTGGSGVGLRGLHERVTSTGGTFEAGRLPDGGFRVRAHWAGRA